jgi:hypothetical protein
MPKDIKQEKLISGETYLRLSAEEQESFTGTVVFWNKGIMVLKNGVFHNELGPAYIEDDTGVYFEYWINGTQLKNCASDEALQLYVDMLKYKGMYD